MAKDDALKIKSFSNHKNLISRNLCENAIGNGNNNTKGWSLLYPLWFDLRPGSRGGNWVTEVFHKWSPGHSAKITILRSQSTNMDEVVREVKY